MSVSERTFLPIAQYSMVEEGEVAVPHIKSVFVALMDDPSTVGVGHQWLETDDAEWRELPRWSTVCGDSGCSALLRDNVYAVCSRVVDEMWRQTRLRQ